MNRVQPIHIALSSYVILSICFCFIKEEVLAPPPENDDVVNDFDIEEEVIEVENRLDFFFVSPCRRKLIFIKKIKIKINK